MSPFPVGIPEKDLFFSMEEGKKSVVVQEKIRQKDIQVFDLAGRLLFNQQENGSFIQTPLNGLPTGVLVVRITAGDQIISRMITYF